MNEKSSMTIKECSEYLGIDQQYVRKLIKEGKLTGKLVNISGTDVKRWMIDRKSIDERKNRTSTSSRNDGRNKYVIYLTKEEKDRLDSLMKNQNLVVPITRANTPEDVQKRVSKAREKRHLLREQKKHDLETLKSTLK